MARRYLLYMADAELNERDLEKLTRILEKRHGKLKVIPVRANNRAVVVRSDVRTASDMRERSGKISLEGKALVTVLTSGAIGKLKRRAAESGTTSDGEVP